MDPIQSNLRLPFTFLTSSTPNLMEPASILPEDLYNQIFKNSINSSSVSPSYTIIKYSTEKCLHRLIKTVLKTFNKAFKSKSYLKTYLDTSCIHTAKLVTTIFLGKEKSKFLFNRFEQMYTFVIYPLNSDKQDSDPWSFDFPLFLDGLILNKINQFHVKFENLSREKRENLIFEYANPFLSELDKYISEKSQNIKANPLVFRHDKIKAIEKVLGQFDLDFNLSLMNQLEKEIEENEKQISEDNSFIYVIGFLENDSSNAYTEKIAEHVKNITIEKHIYYNHVFLLEQFCSPEGKILYKRYQSMADQATLLQDFEIGEKKYKAGIWEKDELKIFLLKLRRHFLYSPAHQPKDCFDHGEGIVPGFVYDKKNHILTGVGLKYFSSPFNPKNILENLASLINSNEKLKHEFAKE